MTLRPSARFAWAAAAVIAVAAALVALVAVVEGDFSETDGRIVGTLALILYCGGAAFAGLTVVERGRRLGWVLAGLAAVCFAAVMPAIWDAFDESGDGEWEIAWLALVTLLGGFVWATGWLAARGPLARRLALATGVLAGIAVLLSDAAILAEDSDGWAKLLAALWILTVLAFVLTPVVGRLTGAPQGSVERVLATLDDVELVVTSGPGLDPGLAAGERLALRRRARAV